ncbi:MAG: putative lipoprotein [Myxococcaceae bacterium]|nr:putative lipoprotein [Myxococcaceae bacterium]
MVMTSRRRRPSISRALGLGAALALAPGCALNVVADPRDDAGTAATTPLPDGPSGAGSVDLLVVVDDSNSMARGQAYLDANLGATVSALLRRHGVRDVHVGVISTNLGTPGATVPSCGVSEGGDQGLLNPRARGTAARLRTPPEVPTPALCRPGGVTDDAFLTLSPADDDAFVLAAPTCHTAIGVGGCGLEQQLEAARRALLGEGGVASANAGFLRPEATLAILVLSDEDDGSVRDCRFHDGVGACVDALDVYDPRSTRWSTPDLNFRLYAYAPGTAQDPTWPLERYVDPARPARGFLGLKPGHPERVVFGAITGVPVAVPRRADGTTDWDALLGPPAPGRPDDFAARDGQRAFRDPAHPLGPISMRQRDPDAQCPRMVPACRYAGGAPAAVCDAPDHFSAQRARRIVEVARRFDESALCAGLPCRNGMVASICDGGNATPFERFADLVGRRVSR